MPIYEYTCKGCGEEFELLLRHDTTAACPSCQSEDIERQLSLTGTQRPTSWVVGRGLIHFDFLGRS